MENSILTMSFGTGQIVDLLARLVVNTIFIFILARSFYFPKSRRRDFFFTYLMLGFAIFMLIHLMGDAKLKTGIAMGLFAIFCIMRYRTESVPIREMTYIFIVIALAAINGLAWDTGTTRGDEYPVGAWVFSIVEVLCTDLIFVFILVLAEKVNWVKGLAYKYIRYDKIDLIVPEKREELIADLKRRTGLEITRVDIGSIDFLKDMALIKIYYNDNAEGDGNSEFKMPKVYE